jgi:hypothetical protein
MKAPEKLCLRSKASGVLDPDELFWDVTLLQSPATHGVHGKATGQDF